ncbi:glycosyltransferase family 21 protein [Jimgerdemannia flammicorona]|nr:glycosyltransferase family 21 protein [Jimgerdemannia flammicorona]
MFIVRYKTHTRTDFSSLRPVFYPSSNTTSRARYTRKPAPQSSQLPVDQAPPVSILRPLKGVDNNLRDNLESTFTQNYPRFEIVFSVTSETDPAVYIVRELMEKYPDVEARLITEERIVGSNPKINNLIRSYETAKHDILWICDSNVYVDRGTLGRSVDKLSKPGVGVVHHLPLAILPESYGAEVEQVFLNTNHAKMYLAINFVAVASCVMGKSNLYRRSDLDRAGGLAAFGKYMAEDNLIAEAIWKQGLRHEMTCDTACQSLGTMSPEDYWLRRSRWVRVRKYVVTAATIVEPFTESIVCGLIGAYGFSRLLGQRSLTGWFMLAHTLVWFACDYILFTTFLGAQSHQKKPMPVWRFARAWITREVVALPLYVFAMAGTKIKWRNTYYRIRLDGTGVPCVEENGRWTTKATTSGKHSADRLRQMRHLVIHILGWANAGEERALLAEEPEHDRDQDYSAHQRHQVALSVGSAVNGAGVDKRK